jgi:hypothetical protein
MAITINQQERDAIWADIQLNHTGLDDLNMAFIHGDRADFREMRERFKVDWRLLDDLGWARADMRDEFTLTMPAPQLEQTIRWHRDRATGSLEISCDEFTGTPGPGVDPAEFVAEVQQQVDEELDLLSACDRVLGQVGS